MTLLALITVGATRPVITRYYDLLGTGISPVRLAEISSCE